jgi:hypothetical protein
MFRSTRKITGLIAVLAVGAALMAPVAFGNDGLVDDWFRDAKPVAQASIGLIDVTAQESSRPLASPVATASVANRIVDDWFRDAKPVAQASIGLIDVSAQESSRPLTSPAVAAPAIAGAPAQSSFAWSEFGIGAGAMLGLVLLLAGIGLGALTVRHRGGSLTTS